jgi:hypothetical protein
MVYGDNRSSEPQHQAVVDALLAEASNPRFIISTGDMVSSGDNESHWDTFFRIEAPLLRRLPLFLAIGNHEVDGGDWDIPRRVFQHPTNLAPASNSESFYHFTYGNAQFIVINAEVDNLYTGFLGIFAGDQEDWLTDILANRPSGIDHRFLFIHKGPYSSKTGRTGNFWLRQWLETFKTSGIDLIVSGHDHYVERGWTRHGIPYLIHGGGGAPLYDTKGARVVSDHTIVYSETRLGYVVVQVDGPKVHVQVKGLTDNVVDEFGWGDAQNSECTVASDCGNPPAYACPGGGWECRADACHWACDSQMSSLVTCTLNSDCAGVLPNCMGTPVCERPTVNPAHWYCRCETPPDCEMDSDCQSRPPPIANCPGVWQCITQACEFTPDTICDEDAGVSSDAGDASMDDGGQSDTGTSTPSAPDAQIAIGYDSGPDAGQVPIAVDAAATQEDASEAPTPSPVKSQCGCSNIEHEQNRGYTSWMCVLGLVLLADLSRRRKNRSLR